ncbi:RNA-directed RNA polymerase L [Dianlovirus menglaense]|uniref:RNA-directed RNA polymerase L n=3 Tax=Filoviridae TaxID=11266 RepID=A0A3Q8U7G4_9MONO|nr:RNA-directed RNA polymerase L [Dianlovirus menglaense]AZL87829.1 RNA-directed RNA polymerase L [Dianlovirus menglaense]
MNSHPTQYPDARLSSPITLDHCDLLSRSCGFYSSYSHNPKIKNCRIPSHIYRLRNSVQLKAFLSNCSVLTLPFSSIWETLLNQFKIHSKNYNDVLNYLKIDEATSYANWDQEFLQSYLKTAISDPDYLNSPKFPTDPDFAKRNNEYYHALILVHHLTQLARRVKSQRGSTRNHWELTSDNFSLFGIGDFFLVKIKLPLLLKAYKSLQDAIPNLRLWYGEQNLLEYYQTDEYLVSFASYESFIMLKDVIIERFNTIEIINRAKIEDQAYQDYPDLLTVLNLYKAGDNIISLSGELGFKLIKFLEPLCASCIQTVGIFTPRKYWFQSQMIKSYNETVIEISNELKLTNSQMDDLYKFSRIIIQARYTPQQYCELFSLQKHWGHPCLHNDTALKKVRQHATSVKILKPKILFETFCTFKFIIAKHHFLAQGGWYKVTHNLDLTPYLKKHILMNSFPNQSEIYEHLWEWYHVKHEALYSTQIISDLSIFIKDRATAVPRECWDSVFDNSVLGYTPPLRFQTKRVPEQFLSQPDFTLSRVIEFAERMEYLDDANRNFSFSLKEKELNVGRTFGKLVYSVRNVQTLCESLLADGLAKAFPSNMMVVTEREQKESLLHQASWHRNSASIGDNAIVRGASFVTDLEKYNLAFRYEFTKPFIDYCNQCYGVKNLFDWMHFLIPLCYMHVSDYYSPPYGLNAENRERPPECENGYYYHLGGIEGFQQKLWTCISCAQITLVELRTRLKLKSCVMGDNQCITTLSLFQMDTTPENQEKIAELNAARVAVELANITGFSGIFLKPEETFVHSGFIYFGKKQYLNGIQLPQSLKTMARCGPLSDSIFDDLQGSLASIGTAFERGISETRHIFPSRWVAAFHSFTAVNLLNSTHLGFPANTSLDIVSLGKPLTYNEKVLALITPQVLGGLSFLNPEKIFYRNISDPLTSGLYQLRHSLMMLGQDSLFTILIAKIPGQADESDFVMNPLGLNVPGSRDITTYLRQIVRQNITLTSQNRVINSLFHIGADIEDKEVCKWLLSSIPVMSRFAADIFSRTPSGKRLQVLGYLEGTRTLLASKTLNLSADGTMIMKLRDLTKKRWRHWFSYLDNFDEDLSDSLDTLHCTVDIADLLRAYSWDDVLQGKKLIGATLPCILEQFTAHWEKYDQTLYNYAAKENVKPEKICKMEEYISCALDKTIVQAHPNADRLSWTIGNHAPYIGSRTEDKIGHPPYKVNCPSAAFKETVEIVSRMLWVTQGLNGKEDFIEPFVKARINLPLETLRNFLPTHYSGNIVHRYNDQYGQHSFMANRMSNSSTRMIISTNTLGKFAGGGQAAIDSNIIFQNAINCGVAIMDIRYATDSAPSEPVKKMRLYLNQCCTRNVPAQYLSFSKPLSVDLSKYKENELIYDPDPLSSGIKGRTKELNPAALSLDLNRSDINSYAFITTSSWTLANTIMTSIIYDQSSGSTDPISTGVTKSFVTQFLIFPLDGLFYSFGAWLLQLIVPFNDLRKYQDKNGLFFQLRSSVQNFSHRSLRILQGTFKHELVIQRLAKPLPLITLLLGGAAGEKGVSDSVRLFLLASLHYFTDNFIGIINNNQKDMPVWMYFPSEGQQLLPIVKYLTRLYLILTGYSLRKRPNKELIDSICNKLWIYPARSTQSNHYYASANFWRNKKHDVNQAEYYSKRKQNRYLSPSDRRVINHSEGAIDQTSVSTTGGVTTDIIIPDQSNPENICNSSESHKERLTTVGSDDDWHRKNQTQYITSNTRLDKVKSSSINSISVKSNFVVKETSDSYFTNKGISSLRERNFNEQHPSLRITKSVLGKLNYKDIPEEEKLTAFSRILIVQCSNISSACLHFKSKKQKANDQVVLNDFLHQFKQSLQRAPESNDYCRFTGVVSSMHYKLSDILPKRKFNSIVCLAEGEGGGARYLLMTQDVKFLFFNTLASTTQIETEILSGRVIPRMLYGTPYLNERLDSGQIILNNLSSQITDITDPRWIGLVKSLLPKDIDLLTMDAETPGNFSRVPLYEVILNLIQLYLGHLPKVLILKIFLFDVPGTKFIISRLINYYMKIDLKKPFSSSARTSEWYLVAELPREQGVTIIIPDEALDGYLITAMRRQIIAIPYWFSYIEKIYTRDLHLSYFKLGFPLIENAFYHRYYIPKYKDLTIYSRIKRYLTDGRNYIRKLINELQSGEALTELKQHFILSSKGRVNKVYNDLIKIDLILVAVETKKTWSQLKQQMPDFQIICKNHLIEKCCTNADQHLVKLDFLKNTTVAEEKFLNRIVGLIIMFPSGIN